MEDNKKTNSDFSEVEDVVLMSVVEHTGDNVMITDKSGIIQYVNPAFERTTGYAKEEVVGKTPKVLQSGKHDAKYYQELWGTIMAGKTFRATTINKNKNGLLYYADQTITSIKDNAGEIKHFVSVWKDVTERMEFQRELEELNKNLESEKHKLEEILGFDEEISLINDINKLCDFIVETVCDMLDSQRCSLMFFDEEAKELCIKGAKGLDPKIILNNKIKIGEGIAGMVAKEGKAWLVEEVNTDERIHRGNRESYKSKSFLSVPIKRDQKLIGVINVTDKNSPEGNIYNELDLKILLGIVRQAGVAIENARMYQELKYLTVTDPMTNLYNYRHFLEALDHEIVRVKRTQRPLCLMMLDVDNFKEYNDTFGHLEGDFLLKEIGKVMHQNLREIDIICRYAGDEFVVVLPETEGKDAQFVADKLLQAIKEVKFKKEITVSIGVAKHDANLDRKEFIRKTDQALYQAKNEGRNRTYLLE